MLKEIGRKKATSKELWLQVVVKAISRHKVIGKDALIG
jgi:hypothetical protein